ncbi:MAG TPA: polysaccharide deacetylase family protein [Rugosimonospora sp.]|jgi:peptidoglycan/xylan/chitin deacetylase (PgdA/CDA1 family)
MNDRRAIETPVTRLSDLGHGTGRVALTFDDGPQPPWTEQILDILEDTGTPATFFVLGSRIHGNEPTLRRMTDLGCAVEVHAWDHIRMTGQEPGERRADIDRTRRLIRDVTAHDPTTVRPPDGHVSLDVLDAIRTAGLMPAFWSVHARDWTRPGVAAIESDVISGLDDGAIVLLHDGGGDRSQTVGALPRIIEAINDRGLRPVSLAPLPRPVDGRQPGVRATRGERRGSA